MQTFNVRAIIVRSARVGLLCLPALWVMAYGLRAGAAAPAAGLQIRHGLTLLNDIGRLNRVVPAAEVARWRRLLQRRHLPARRAARLHLWLGEIEIARNLEPGRALEQFQQAQQLSRPLDPVYGCAAFDRAFTLFRHGAYAPAVSAFHDLLRSKSVRSGYSRTDCMLWRRHAMACAGYHAQHAKLGITEPPSLDPLCGVASLAACLQAHGRACDRKTLLSHCRMTGLGNNMQDLIDCAKRLGMSARCVRTDEEGLKLLPKPLVAHVEEDHFIAVTRADKDGVSYLCSDCGAWPGGRRDLSWKQWRAMDCSICLVVTQPGSGVDNALRTLQPENAFRPAATRTNGSRLAALHSPEFAAVRAGAIRLLGAHTILFDQATSEQCGLTLTTNHCSTQSAPTGSNGSQSDVGATSGDPVNLATGEEEYRPQPDLTVYNPIGPSVVWQRGWQNLLGPSGSYQLAYGYGWSTGYDYQAVVVGTQISVTLPNSAGYLFNAPSAPTASNPQVACPAAIGGTPMLCTWNYNADGSLSLAFTQMDRSQWVFSSVNGYALTQRVDRNGNYITFSYTGSPGLLTAIKDSKGQPLLTIQRKMNGNITSVSDRYGRSVYYKVKRFVNRHVPVNTPPYYDELIQVSQVVRTGTLTQPFRYLLGYLYNPGADLITLGLHTITVPSPTGQGVSTATLSYINGYISSVRDGNGNTTTYDSGTPWNTTIPWNTTVVTVTDPAGNVVTSYTVTYDAQMRTASRTDGTNQTLVYNASYSGNGGAIYAPPSQETDGNNTVTSYSYDQYGQVLSKTSPRNVTTTYTRDYSVFPLGELKQIQEGSKSPISFTYYEPSDLIQTITTPTPGTSGASGGVSTSLTYDGLGNILTVTRPGNDTTATITTTLNYTTDGAYSQPDAIGQPLTVTDNLGHATHYRYDAQGNRTAMIDAIGIESDFRYNIANQQTKTIVPAIGDITNLIGVTRSQLTYVAASKTYNGTLTLTNTGSQAIQGFLLAALTNLAPGVTLTNATGTYVNSPTLGPVSLGTGSSTTLNVSFSAPSANTVYYGVQTYLTDAKGNALAQGTVTQSLYLYPSGPLAATQTYDETGALYRQISYGYGKEGELLSRTGSTEPVTYTYDGAYRLSTLADGNGNATTYAYNLAGWLASVTYPMGDGQQYPSYDPAGHLLKRIDGRGIETDYTYNDPESKLTNVAYVNSASYPNVSQYNVTIDYDGYGRQQDVYDFSGHTHLDYDDLDTQTEIDTTYLDASGHSLPTVSLTYSFNPDGSRHAMNVATTTTNYSFAYGYDAAGRAQSLTNPFSETAQWTYLNNNWLASQQYANGVLCQYAYNRRGFMNDLTNYSPAGAPLSDFGAMVYDVAANRLMQVVSIPGAPSGYSGQTAYAYDIKDQLIQEQSTLLGGYAENFSYDPVGNPLSFKSLTNSFNADNQFIDTGFAYDGDGNPTTYAGAMATFDPEDHITSFGAMLKAGYRADGVRAWKQSASGRTYYIYHFHLPVLEMDGTGAITAVNTFGANGLLSRHTSSGRVYYSLDPQGNVSERLDAGANVITTSAFDAFGAGVNTAGPSDPFGYGGQFSYYTDAETSLLLLGHRYYHTGEGRFLTRDPIDIQGGINVYAYARNNPVDRVDPDGYDSISVIGNGELGPSPSPSPSPSPPKPPKPLIQTKQVAVCGVRG